MTDHNDDKDLIPDRDPVTDAPEFHPVGTGVGATGGGVAGAAIGTAVGGPVGGVIGAVIGAVSGGLAGKGVAEAYDPTDEEGHWRENYAERPYVKANAPYDTYRPAYAYGFEARRRNLNARWDDIENDLERGWDQFKDKTELKWDEAKDAVRDGWDRVETSFRNLFRDEDEHWRTNYGTRPYAAGGTYETYEPAYRYGYQSRVERVGDRWDGIENDLERGWDRFKGASKLTWQESKEAVRDGWHHVERALPGDFDRDGR